MEHYETNYSVGILYLMYLHEKAKLIHNTIEFLLYFLGTTILFLGNCIPCNKLGASKLLNMLRHGDK